MTKTCLPHDDAAPSARRRALDDARAALRYDYTRFSGIAMLPGVPTWAEPGVAWLAEVAERLVEVAVNATAVDGELSRMHPDHPDHHTFRELFQAAGQGGARAAFELLVEIVEGSDEGTERATSLADFDALFVTLPLPAAAATVRDDRAFARLRVAGPNPMTLRHEPAPPDAIDDATFGRALAALGAPPMSLAEAGRGRRLYACDYRSLGALAAGTWAGGRKELPAPYVLFATVTESRELLPTVILLDAGRAVTAADGAAWTVAKSLANVADGTVHQAVVHLAHTHLVLEPMAIALHRQLGAAHPVHQLLAPHFEGTFFINDAAEARLAAPGGGVDRLLAPPIATSRAVAVDAVQQWDFAASMLERNLRDRGVDDAGALPDFPYRDDARLIHGALRDWVEAYLRLWYADDAAVAGDEELVAWLAELGAPDGGRLQGVPHGVGLAGLVELVTHVVFTASAHHAAVNFPQGAAMVHAPAFPLSAYAPDRVATTGEDAWLETLPPLGLAQLQGALGHLLGGVRHTRLGEYPVPPLGHFAQDARTAAPLAALATRLEAIERTIHARNTARVPYPYLLPSLIPMSTNI